jgi:Rrf2 family protein
VKLSSQEEYGLRCLLQVARRGENESIALAEMSRLEGISVANAAKIMRLLRRAGFLRSSRGQTGGYALARPADAISVGEVLSALGGRLFDSTFCDRHAGVETRCTHMGDCSIRPVLRRLQDVFDGVLGRMMLSELLRPERHVRVVRPGAVELPMLSQRSG